MHNYNGIKILSVLERLHGEGAQTLTFKSVTDRQTNRQTALPNFGMVIEDLEHVLAPLNFWGV